MDTNEQLREWITSKNEALKEALVVFETDNQLSRKERYRIHRLILSAMKPSRDDPPEPSTYLDSRCALRCWLISLEASAQQNEYDLNAVPFDRWLKYFIDGFTPREALGAIFRGEYPPTTRNP